MSYDSHFPSFMELALTHDGMNKYAGAARLWIAQSLTKMQWTHHGRGASLGRRSCRPSCIRRTRCSSPPSRTAGGAPRPSRTATWRRETEAGGSPTQRRRRRTPSGKKRSSSRSRKVKCCSWLLLPGLNSLSVPGTRLMLSCYNPETQTFDLFLVLRVFWINLWCRLSSGARVVIQYTVPCNDSDEGSER